MTKDLSLCVHGQAGLDRSKWVTTNEYISAVVHRLEEGTIGDVQGQAA